MTGTLFDILRGSLRGSVCFKHNTLYGVWYELLFVALPNGHIQRQREKSAVSNKLYNLQSVLEGSHNAAAAAAAEA